MSSERRPLIAANWKMNKTRGRGRGVLRRAAARGRPSAGPEVVVCPPYLALSRVVELCDGAEVRVAAQNMHFEPAGAYTGEVSAAMLVDAGATAVVLGHSERRQMFGETDEALARKVPAALEAGLLPILCCGETEEERDGDDTDRVLRRQIDAGLARVAEHQLGEVVVAYEPIWAIGTGRTATPEQADDACGFIRALIAARSEQAAEAGPDPLRRLDEARKRRRAARQVRDRRRAGRRRQPRARRLRGDRRGGMSGSRCAVSELPSGAASTPVPGLALIILDGWGLADPGPGNAISLAADAGLRRALGALSAHPALGVGPRCRPARRADGQLRGRPPQPRRGLPSSSRTWPGSTMRSATAASSTTRC